MNKKIFGSFALVFAIAIMVTPLAAAKPDTGFDEYGYNRNANLFVGRYASWYQEKNPALTYEEAVTALAPYGNDKLVMKWNDEWDRGNAEGWTDTYYGAWCTNHWNGKVQDGSGEVEQVKIIWVGAELESSEYWREGGYAIWGQFEVIMDHYVAFENAEEFVKAVPNGLMP